VSNLRVFGDRRMGIWIGGIAAFFVFCLMVWFLMPPSPAVQRTGTPPDPFADPAAGAAHIRKLAAQYGDHFERLSADDKTFLNAIAMGHGRELLAKTVNQLKVDTSRTEGATLQGGVASSTNLIHVKGE